VRLGQCRRAVPNPIDHPTVRCSGVAWFADEILQIGRVLLHVESVTIHGPCVEANLSGGGVFVGLFLGTPEDVHGHRGQYDEDYEHQQNFHERKAGGSSASVVI